MTRFLATAAEVAAALKPSLVDGKWKRPLISARIAAKLRKKAILNGTYGTYVDGQGGWDSSWDKPQKNTVMKKPKLHIRERNVEERVTRIQNALAAMPEKLKLHYEELEKRKPLPGLRGYLNMPGTGKGGKSKDRK